MTSTTVVTTVVETNTPSTTTTTTTLIPTFLRRDVEAAPCSKLPICHTHHTSYVVARIKSACSYLGYTTGNTRTTTVTLPARALTVTGSALTTTTKSSSTSTSTTTSAAFTTTVRYCDIAGIPCDFDHPERHWSGICGVPSPVCY